jgi:hypothetical protein
MNLLMGSEARLIQREQSIQLSDFIVGPKLGTDSYGRVRQIKLKHNPKEVYTLKMLKI